MDNKIFEFLYGLSEIKIIEDYAFFLSYPFSYGLIVFIFLWCFFKKSKKLYSFGLLFLSSFFSLFFSYILKNIFTFDRPFWDLDLMPVYVENSFSFPSAHTALFFALAYSVYFLNKKLGIVFFVFASLIAVSRVVLALHYVLDILGGFVLGILISFVLVKIFKKFK